jgi:signal transduction histidine kinase
VFLLAGFAFFSVRQDQRLVEEEARGRAQDMAQQLCSTIGDLLSRRISEYQVSAQNWATGVRQWRPPWPGTEANVQLRQGRPNFERWLADWQRAHGGVGPSSVLVPAVWMDETGELLLPRDWEASPTPPRWFREMNAASMERWERATGLISSGANGVEIADAWHNFLSSSSNFEANANVDLALLRLQLRTNPPSVAQMKLLDFAQNAPSVRTESGLPLRAVVLASAFELGKENGATELLFRLVHREIETSPSMLCPYLIRQASRLAERDSHAVQDAAAALANEWELDEQVRALVRALRERVTIHSGLATNIWFSAGTNRWLAMVRPGSLSELGSEQGSVQEAVSSTDPARLWIRFLPGAIVIEALNEAARTISASLPAYAGIKLQLESEPAWNDRQGKPNTKVSRLLAESEGRLAPSFGTGLGLPSDRSASGRSQELASIEPRFTLGIYLIHPATLYRYQQHRSFWLSALILAVATTAIWGLLRARRAFQHEHQLSELKGNFVASVSHELRAPIASIRLMAESLERGKVQDAARQQEYFRFIGQECRRLSGLIANVLDFSRIDQGRKQYEFEPTNVAQLFHETIRVMQSYAHERGVPLVATTIDGAERSDASGTAAPASVEPRLDGRAVQQALVNVIDNAVKHSRPGSPVGVRLELPGSAIRPLGPLVLRFVVEDHGPGIPLEEQERIFERFYRLGSELRRQTEGVGIGLSIVKHVVDAHCGRVQVSSTVGKGSIFVLEFPYSQEPALATPKLCMSASS